MAKKSFIAGVDLTDKIGYAIIADNSTGKVKLAGTAGASCLGILMNDGKADASVGVAMVGEVTKAKIAGTVEFGELLATDANGKLVALTSDDVAVAKALQAGASGDRIYVVVL